MIVNALFATTVIFLAVGLWLMQECTFLIPYRSLLYHKYGGAITEFAAVLFINVFAGVYLLCRKLFLKDTGRKLAHLDKQLRTAGTISEELSQRLQD